MILTELLALSHVPRWAIVPHLIPQSVADHVYRTTVIFIELADAIGVGYEHGDLITVLTHDLAEARTGDIPTPAKVDLGIPPENLVFTHDQVRRVFQLADLIEAYTFIERWGTGEHSRRVAAQLRTKIVELAGDDFGVVMKLIDTIAFDVGR